VALGIHPLKKAKRHNLTRFLHDAAHAEVFARAEQAIALVSSLVEAGGTVFDAPISTETEVSVTPS